MTVTELKKAISQNTPPMKMVWVDNNHTLVEHYLDQLSIQFNRKFKKIFTPEEAVSIPSFDIEVDNTIYLLYLPKKEIAKTIPVLGNEWFIIMVDEEVKDLQIPQIVFGKLSRNACIVFLEKYVEIGKKKRLPYQKDTPIIEIEHYISRELLERVVDYFEDDLDRCMNEIKKVEALELNSSWNHPFEALLDCLPPKDTKLRSLPWFSGGDVDTCQVLYNLYVKKLRTLPETETDKQNIWAKLIKEAIWCEACIVSGLLGDYVADYLRLVEMSLPGDFEVQYFPPVFYHELENFPEWKKVSEDKDK